MRERVHYPTKREVGKIIYSKVQGRVGEMSCDRSQEAMLSNSLVLEAAIPKDVILSFWESQLPNPMKIHLTGSHVPV